MNGNPELPREMRAVLMIFNADEEMKQKTLPHVNVDRQTIDWKGILANDFGGGHSAAILWARCIWNDSIPVGRDPISRVFSMGERLRGIVLRALAVRWGLWD